MNEDGTAGRDTDGEQPRPDSSMWSQQHDTTPLDWSGQASAQQAASSGYGESPWARPSGATPPAGSVPPPGATPPYAAPQYGAPQYGAPQYGAPSYASASAAGGVPPHGWPGSPYAAEPVPAHHGLSGARLAIAGLALVVVSAASSALLVNAIKSSGHGAVAASTQTPNIGGTQNPGNGGNGSRSSGGSSLSTSQIAQAVDQGVVDVTTNLGYQNASAAGTGMVLTSSGEILTNNHVVRGATTIKVTVVTTGKTYTAKVVGTDPTDDVAVLQAQGASGLSTIPLGNSSSVQVGDAVVAIGNAGGTGGMPSVVTGSVTNLNQTITASDENGSNAEQLHGLIQVNAPIQAGDSGGPLSNRSGKVIGMDTAASSTQARFSDSSASQGYAIPINDALAIAKKIESGQASSKIHIGLPGFLGVEVADSSSANSNSGGFGGFGGLGNSGGNSASGALVQGTTDNSPAAAAGIGAGDVITSVNGTTVDSAQTLTSLLSGHHKGDKVTVDWTDSSGQTHSATITLAEGPAD